MTNTSKVRSRIIVLRQLAGTNSRLAHSRTARSSQLRPQQPLGWHRRTSSPPRQGKHDAERCNSRLIQIWFAAVALVVVAGIALGVSVTGGTGAMLLALSLVPAFLILMLWPGRPAPTIAEVLYNGKRRR